MIEFMKISRHGGPLISSATHQSIVAGNKPVILFVLGMGRSGTSALTRVLSLCGATLPPGMMGADDGNPRGYWEPRAALQLNERFLYRHHSSYFDPSLRLQEEDALTRDERKDFVAKIAHYLSSLPASPLTVIKTLHISFLSDMWFEAAEERGFDLAAVIAVRNPLEVAASLAKFMVATPQLAEALWLKYNLLAERHTRHLPRAFVDYSNFLEDWRREVKRIATTAPVDLRFTDDMAVEDFLEAGLHRNRDGGPMVEHFGSDWLSVAYDTFRSAANDEPWEQATLDRVFEQYRATERGFRIAYDDFDSHFNLPYRVSRLLMKPVAETMALAHRRRGSWA